MQVKMTGEASATIIIFSSVLFETEHKNAKLKM